MPTYSVVARPHPFRPTVVRFTVPVGDSLELALADAAERAGTKLALLRDAFVAVGDRRVPPARWARVKPKAGAEVVVVAVPNAAVVPIIASIAANYGAAALIPTAFALAHPIATALIIGGITTVAGALAAQLIAPTPKQINGGRGETVDARYTITGIRNEARPYGVIPKVYGRRVNHYPLLAAQPYSETVWGEEQYVRMLFDVGHGPLAISDIKIGDTPIAQFEDIDYQVREGYGSDAAITLYPATVREEALSIQLKQIGGWSMQTTPVDTDEVTLDIQFPGGLQRITDRNVKFGLGVQFEVQIRLASGGSWQSTALQAPASGILISGSSFEIQANSKSAVRRTVRVVFPTRDQWQVQIRRLTADDQSDNTGENQSVTTEDSYWTAFRSFRNAAPVNNTGIARIAVRCRATDQLNGTVDQLNCTVVSVLPVWNGSTWTEQETRNPAWVFADILRGDASARPLSAARLDLDALLAWATWCDANGFTFDGVFDQRTSVWEALQEVCATGCASPSIRDGLYSVVVDNTRASVVQHLTPRNSWGFKATKVFASRPHALKVRFPNEETRHQVDELIVYEQGYDAGTATVFEALDLPWTTSATAAWKRARRALAAARLRPEIYQLQTDVEHLALTRGDLVRVTHDVPLWGLAGARVKALITSGSDTTGVTLDAAVTMTGGTSYGLRCRLSDGTSSELALTTVAGTSASLTFATPVATAAGPQVGDLVQFGEYGSESVELLVRSIEPGPDLTATLTLVDYAPAIQTSDSGDIPAFDPQITVPPVVNRATPPLPQIVSVASDEDALLAASDGTLTSRILVGVQLAPGAGNVAAESIQARFRDASVRGDWIWTAALGTQGGELSLLPVEDGATYTIQVRSVSALGATSDWREITHTVIGKTAPPPDVERLYRSGDTLIWPYPSPPRDLAGFELRAHYGTNTDWGSARRLHAGVVAAPPFSIADLAGTQTVLIKAVDTSGIYSASAASVTLALGDLLVANVVDTQSEAPGFTGTLTGGTDTGTQIEASLVASAPRYGAADAQFYGTAGDPFYAGNYYDEMTYVARYTPDTLYLGDGVLKLELTVTGQYALDYRISTSPAFYGAGGDPLYGTADDPFYADSDVGAWQPWPGQLGPFETTADTYDLRVTTAAGATQGVVSQFDLITDLPDVVERLEDVVIAATSTRLPITQTFRAITGVQLTVQTDGNGGVTARIIDKDASLGPDVEVLNASGTAVIGLVDAIIQGY